MSVIQIIVPAVYHQLHFLEECLRSVKNNTPVNHVVNVAIGKQPLEERIGEIVATARGVYERTGLVITCCPPEFGYNGAVMEVLKDGDFEYTVVLPVTHRIEDDSWFGKMQLPHIRARGCGMTFAPDEEPANTLAPSCWGWRQPIPSQFFMLQRAVMDSARAARIDLDGADIITVIRDHLRTVATNCWVVPSCRVAKLQSEPW